MKQKHQLHAGCKLMSVSHCVRYLCLFGEQSHEAFGGPTPHHHLVTGSHQPPCERTGEVPGAQDADDWSPGVGDGGLQTPGTSSITSDQGPRHVIRHNLSEKLKEDRVSVFLKVYMMILYTFVHNKMLSLKCKGCSDALLSVFKTTEVGCQIFLASPLTCPISVSLCTVKEMSGHPIITWMDFTQPGGWGIEE